MSINFVERAVHGLFTSTKTTVSTVLDSDGVLKNTLHNLLPSTDLSDTAVWTHEGLDSVVASGTSPSGKTAYLVTENSAGGEHYITDSVTHTAGVYYKFSYDVKAAGRDFAILLSSTAFGTGVKWSFDLSAVTTTQLVGGTNDAAFIVDLGNGYYRCDLYAQATANSGSALYAMLYNGTTTSYTGDGSSGVYLSRPRVYRAAVHAPVERVTNGDFATSSDWTLGAGWSIGSGVASCDGTQTARSSAYQTALTVGVLSRFEFTISGYVAGAVRLRNGIGDTEVYITDKSANGTYVATATPAGGTTLVIDADADFVGSIDNVSVTKVITNGMQKDLSGSDYVETSGSAEFHAGLEYDGNGAFRGLQAFEGRTNYATNSNGAPTGTGITATANAAVGLDGDLSLTRVAKDATDPRYFVSATTGLTVAAATNYVVSRLVKYDGYALDVSLEYNSNLNWDVAWSADFSVAASVVTAGTAANCTSGVDDLGGGIYRIWATFTTGASPIGTNPSVLSQITGGSGNSVLVSEFNVQAGKSVSPEIPTNGSTVSRGADVTFKALSEFGFKQDQYTVIVEFESADTAQTRYILSIDDGSSNNESSLWIKNDDTYRQWTDTAGANTLSSNFGSYTPNSVSKVSAAFKQADHSASDDGSAAVTSSDADALPPVTTLSLGYNSPSANHLNGYIKKMVIFPARLTDATLVAESA